MGGLAAYIGHDPPFRARQIVRHLLAAQRHASADPSVICVVDPTEQQAHIEEGSEHVPSLSLAAWSYQAHYRVAAVGGQAVGPDRLTLDPTGDDDVTDVVAVLDGTFRNQDALARELGLGTTPGPAVSAPSLLVAAYRRWGEQCLDHLDGSFAIIVLDLGRARVMLARDRLGLKSMFHARCAQGIAVTSGIPPLLDLDSVSRRVSRPGVIDYLRYGLTDHRVETPFADVHCLPPGHRANITLPGDTVLSPVRYWTPDVRRTADLSFEEAAAGLREQFLDSVAAELPTHGPIGVTLSGGLDSTAIAMAVRHIRPDVELHTFSYIGDGDAVTEEPWIDTANSASNAQAHKLRLDRADWEAGIADVTRHQAEPFGSPAIFIHDRLFRLAAAVGVSRTLSGMGADQLLAGRAEFQPAFLASLLRRGRLPSALRFLFTARSRPTPRRRMLRAAVALTEPDWLRTVRPRSRADIPPWLRDDWATGEDDAAHMNRSGYPLRDAIVDALVRHLPIMLRYEDRNSAACGIETGFPFLSAGFVERSLTLPEEYFMSPDGRGKHVFRAAMRDLVPAAVLERTDDIGFSVPVRTWLAQSDACARYLETAQTIPALNPTAVTRLLGQVTTGEHLSIRDTYLAWRIIGLSSWSDLLEVDWT